MTSSAAAAAVPAASVSLADLFACGPDELSALILQITRLHVAIGRGRRLEAEYPWFRQRIPTLGEVEMMQARAQTAADALARVMDLAALDKRGGLASPSPRTRDAHALYRAADEHFRAGCADVVLSHAVVQGPAQ